MGIFDKLSDDIREAYGSNIVFSLLLGAAPVLMFIAVAFDLIQCTIGAGRIFGDLLIRILAPLVLWMFIFGALGTYAARKNVLVFIGLAAEVLANVITLVRALIPSYGYWYVDFSALTTVAITGFMAYIFFNHVKDELPFLKH